MSRKSFKYDWQWHQLERNIFVSLEGANTRFPRFIDCTMRLSSPRSLHGKLRIGSRVAEIAKCAWIPRKNPGPPLEIPTFPGLPRELPNESLHSRFVLAPPKKKSATLEFPSWGGFPVEILYRYKKHEKKTTRPLPISLNSKVMILKVACTFLITGPNLRILSVKQTCAACEGHVWVCIC